MARKSQKKGKSLDTGHEKYDIVISQRHVMKNGFHKSVTSQSPEEIEREWAEKAVELSKKKKKPDTIRYLTSAMLLLRYETRYAVANKKTDERIDKNTENSQENNMLLKFLSAVHVGGEITNAIFAEGLGAVLNVAITSSTSWFALSNSAKIWDFNAAGFRTDGNSGVLLAVVPESTVGEMELAHALDPYGLSPSNSISGWCGEAMKLEREIYLSIHLLHGRIKRTPNRKTRCRTQQEVKKIMPVDFLAKEIVQTVKGINDIKTIWGAGQFVSSPKNQLFEPSAIFAVTRLRGLLKQISEQRNSFRVLYLQKIPFLDRRMAAVILRACPNVSMVGIYECPLIHFGDVLCLIDLIYEINYDRRKLKLPEIKGLDFYPHYNKGSPFKTSTTAIYGLTWSPHKLDVVQRGFFNIILKAFMKAKRMKLGLLFDQDKAFVKYLNQIPNYPIAVPTFLDAMYRYMEVKDEKMRKRILYDLLKPVRLGVETHIEKDWPVWYTTIMGKTMLFCSSCGYETPEEFFSAYAREVRPHRRVCAGCTLQHWLDDEDDHLKAHKKEILDTLFPDWNGLEFNSDAPAPTSVKNILRLYSTSSVRPQVPELMVDSNGELYAPQTITALIRDNKLHHDSLQNLPSLTDLLTGKDSTKTWGHVYNKCNNLDVYCRAIRRVRQENFIPGGEMPAVLKGRCDGGMPDHVEELQPPKQAGGCVSSHDFESAFLFYVGVACTGWAGYQK